MKTAILWLKITFFV